MKIIDYGYLVPSIIIMIGIPFLLYLKLSQSQIHFLDITIYGSTVQTAIFTYYIDKHLSKLYGQNQKKKYLNITLVSPFDIITDEKMKKQTDKILLTFCGVQHRLITMLNDLNLQFQINQYGIYFSQLKKDKNFVSNLQTYKIKQQYPIQSFLQYGLSHITAKDIFQDFQYHLDQSINNNYYQTKYAQKSRLKQLSMTTSIKNIFPYDIEQSGIKYLSEKIGLDQQYINDYIMPVIWGSYLHQGNSITTMYKLLPLYCTKNKQIGNSLAILINEDQLYRKIMQNINHININHVYNNNLQQFKTIQRNNQNNNNQNSQTQIQVTYLHTFINQTKQKDRQKQQQHRQFDQKHQELSNLKMKTNLLFIIQDKQMINKKQISYYKTIVDGKIHGDQNFQQYFTLYFNYQNLKSSNKDIADSQNAQMSQKNKKYIYSATRLCKQNCKNFNQNVYLLISKQKLNQKDLGMFEQHHIVYYKKFWMPKTQLPSNKKFQQSEGVYRIYDTQSISDSYQFKLTVFDQLSKIVINKMKN